MLRGLYIITDRITDDIGERVDAALGGGAVIVQYRDKHSPLRQRAQIAARLKEICRARGALFIVNDDTQIAQRVDADGVHLGRDDTSLAAARTRLGAGKIIGVSCYADIAAARAAARGGADYVAFGRFFPSKTKPQAAAADTAVLRQARRELSVPIAAVGGINAANAAPLVAAGADMLACADGVLGRRDITQSARALAGLFV